MNKRIFSIMVVLALVAAAFFSAGGAQAAPTDSDIGIAAYANIVAVDLEAVKPAFLMIEYEFGDILVGTLDMPLYDAIYDPLVLVTAAGDIVAFYPNTDPAGKLLDVVSKNLDETLLEKAVKIVAAAAGVEDVETLPIYHYDFRNPDAETMLLVAEHESDGNAFTLQFDIGNTYYEKSYAFYRNYGPSFTLDNDAIDQVNFVLVNADYTGAASFGTIYGHFTGVDPNIDFTPEVLNTFAVFAGDHLGFGALAILYSGEALNTVADADFMREIDLVDPGIDPAFDLTPSAPDKASPADEATGVVLNPTLSWGDSTAPNYEYCIDTVDLDAEPAPDPDTHDCETGWISTGSSTSVALSNLFYETDYFWQVRAVNSYDVVYANDGTWWSFTTADGEAPWAFTKDTTTLKEPIDSLSKVTMTWTPSYGAYYYEVCVDTTAECIAPELWHNVGLNTSATIGDLLLDTTYYWQVRAVNDYPSTENVLNITYADEGVWQSFTTRRFSKLSPMDDEVKSYNITLPIKWEATPLAKDGYEYCIDVNDDGDCDSGWIGTPGTSDVVKKLEAGTTYYWQVRVNTGTTVNPIWVYANPGVDDDGNQLPTGDWWMFEVLSKKDSRNINLFKDSPVNGAVDQPVTDLELSWHATGTFDSYEYCFFDIDETDTTPISDDDHCTYPVYVYDPEHPNDPPVPTWPNWVPVGTTTSATISGLSNATTYYWQVRGNLGGALFYADNGDYWTFTTGTFRKLSPEDGAFDQPVTDLELTWSAANDALSYEYCFTTDETTCGDWFSVGTATSALLPDLAEEITYYWQVRANIGTELVPDWLYADDGDDDYWTFTTGATSTISSINKESPVNGATNQPVSNLPLIWDATGTDMSFEYCFFAHNNPRKPISKSDTCSGQDENWVDVGTDLSEILSSLSNATTYYWQVRANIGTELEPDWLYADNGDYWAFTTQ